MTERLRTGGWLEWTALWIVYIGWGSTYLGIRVMVETIPPLLGAGVRYLAAGALLAAWLRLRRGPGALSVSRVELRSIAVVGVLLLVGGNGMLTVGEQTVPAGLASLVIAAVPLWIVVVRLVFRERPERATLAGVLVGLAGVAILMLPGDRPEEASIAGLLLLVFAALSWAVGSVLSGRLAMPKDAFSSTAIEMLVGGAVLMLLALAAGEQRDFDVGSVSAVSLAGLVHLIVIGSIVSFSAYVWLLQNAPIARVATYAYVNPVVAVGLGALLLGEEVTPTAVVAAAVIVAAVAFVVRSERPRAAQPAEPEPASRG